MTLDEAIARLIELRDSTPNSGGFEVAIETYIGWSSVDKIEIKYWFANSQAKKTPFVVIGDPV